MNTMKTAYSKEFKNGKIIGFETEFINYKPKGEIVCFVYEPVFNQAGSWDSRKRIEVRRFPIGEEVRAENYVKRMIRIEGDLI